MAVTKRSTGMLLTFMLVGGLLGGVFSEILVFFSPNGVLREAFLRSFQIGIPPPVTLDLHIISLTVGLEFKINLLSIVGIVLGLYTYKQI